MTKKIFIIAGEESGDNLGAKLIRSLKEKSKEKLEFVGIGGSKMAAEGLHVIFPMREINLMGFAEIVPHIPRLMKRINETIERILIEKPDILITIDSPGFNFRIAKKLKQKNISIKKIHYVAPSVWAYKKGRAKKIAKLYDHLICLLPWETKYFEKEGLTSTFIGHPVFEDLKILNDKEKADLRKDYNYTENDKLIAILPGSRMGEVKLLLPIFIEAAKKIYENNSNAKFILMPTETMRTEITKFDHLLPNEIIVSDTEEKRKLLQICDAAIVKSGTVALEVAALKCPNVVCYKVNPISHWLIRRMLYIDLANLVNISAHKQIIRELIQNDCTPENISNEILRLINTDIVAKGQIEEASYELGEMGLNAKEKSSDKAADVVLNIIK